MATTTPTVINKLEQQYAVESPVLNNVPSNTAVPPIGGMPKTTGLPVVLPELPTIVGKDTAALTANLFVPKGARTTTATPVELTQVPDTPSMWESAKAGFAPIARDWGNRLVENIEFDADPSYTDTERQADIKAYSVMYGDIQERDIRRLNGANSQRHFHAIVESLVDAKRDDAARAAHPIVAGVVGIVDADLALMVVPPVGATAKAAKGAQLAVRAVAGAGLAAGVNTVLGDNSNRDDFSKDMDSVLFGVAALLPLGKAKGAGVPVSTNLIETDVSKVAADVAPIAPPKQYSGLTAPLPAPSPVMPTMVDFTDRAAFDAATTEYNRLYAIQSATTTTKADAIAARGAMADMGGEPHISGFMDHDAYDAAITAYNKATHTRAATVAPAAEDIVSGSTTLSHGSQVDNLSFYDPTAPVMGALPVQPPVVTKLPKELAGAKPTYSYTSKQFTLEFTSDLDKAAYIAAGKKPSKADAAYVAFVSAATGMTEAEVRAHGQVVRAAIKTQAKTADAGVLQVPDFELAVKQVNPTGVPQPRGVPDEARGYGDSVFGNDVVYLGEHGQHWSTRDRDVAAAGRMPFYEHRYAVDATFDKAFVFTPKSLPAILTILKDSNLAPSGARGAWSGTDIVAALKGAGYDGLIVRDMPEFKGTFELGRLELQGLATRAGMDEEVFQSQVVAFKPDNLKVLGKTEADAPVGSTLTPHPDLVRLEAESAIEMQRIADEVSAHADTVGTLGKTNVLGVDVKMPISQPVQHGFDTTNNKMWSKLQSSADEMMHYLKGDGANPLSKVLAAPRTQGDNIPYATAATQSVLESKLVSTELALDAAAKVLYNTGRYPIVGRAKHMQSQYAVSQQFGEAMQRLDQTVVERLNDKIPTSTQDILAMVDSSTLPEPIKAAQRAYINSGFAEEALKRARDTGLLDHVDDIAKLHQRSTYMPVRHSFEKMHNLIQTGRVDAKTVHKYLGTQIIRMYPEMQVEGFTHGNKLTPKLSAEDLGRNFFANQEKLALGQSAVVSAGLTREQLETLLRSAGVSDDSIKHVANTIYETGSSEGTAAAKHLRKRLSWDWSMRAADNNGGTFGLADLVDGNAYMNLTDYARTMSHRIGAAQYGIKSTADYETLKEAALKSLPAGTSIDEAKRFMDNAGARMFGHAVGEDVPPTLRSLSTLSGMMLLANSGLYNLVDAVTMVGKLGLMRTLPQIRKGLTNTVNPMKQLNKNEAGDLEDILTGLLSIDGRWRHFTMRYADNFEVAGSTHRSIQHYGQSTKFLNGSEYVKRMQVGMIGGVIVSAFKGAARGSTKDITYLKDTLKFSDELTQAVVMQFKEHGHNIDMWDNVTRMNMEQKVFFEADNLAHTIRAGEIPSFMEHSSVGKVVFPFMSFMFAMQQKVLRNNYQRDGAAGVALVAALQFPTAVMVGMVKNIKAGKEPDEDLAAASANALSVSGIFGYPLDIILNGGMKTSSATLAPVSNVLSLGQKIYNDNATPMDVLKASPLGAASGILGVVNALAED